MRYERARIARELHDIVAHNLSMIVVQANAGVYLAPPTPTAPTRRSGRSARPPTRPAPRSTASPPSSTRPRPPPRPGSRSSTNSSNAPGPPGCTSPTRSAGTSLTCQGIAETNLRVVQEAITNALKHVPGAAITIRLQGRDDRVEVVVRNPAPTAPGSPAVSSAAELGVTGGRRGLAGMRERVHQHGGRFQAGPDGAGGWDVTARLPRRVGDLPDHDPDHRGGGRRSTARPDRLPRDPQRRTRHRRGGRGRQRCRSHRPGQTPGARRGAPRHPHAPSRRPGRRPHHPRRDIQPCPDAHHVRLRRIRLRGLRAGASGSCSRTPRASTW